MKKKFIILRIIIALTSLFGISAMTYLITSLASFDFNPVNWTLGAKVYFSIVGIIIGSVISVYVATNIEVTEQ